MTKEYDGDILYIILYYVDKKKVRFSKTRTCSIVSFVRLFFHKSSMYLMYLIPLLFQSPTLSPAPRNITSPVYR